MNPAFDLFEILGVRARYDVRFIVAGGVSGVFNGAPIATLDLDIVHLTNEENVRRITLALEELDAVLRIQPERRLRPGKSDLMSPGHQLLVTRAGALDLLGSIGAGEDYNSLLDQSIEMLLDTGIRVRVLKLETLIRLKESLGREKDKATLAILRQTLAEKTKP